MSRSWSCRGQTEPIAALVAVVAMAIALGLYGGFLSDVLTDRSDRTHAEVAIDRIWDDASHDGVFSQHRSTGFDDVRPESLPEGQNVYVEVTMVEADGTDRVVSAINFESDGTRAAAQVGPPEEGSGIRTTAAERPVPVEGQPGDVRGGTLRVEVWSP